MAKSKRCKKQGKRKYKNENQAIVAAIKYAILRGFPFRHYQCPGTPHWHISKVRPPKGGSNEDR